MQPNTYTDQGTREFSRKRKESLDSIFGNEEIVPFEIKPRVAEEILIKPDTPQIESTDMPQVGENTPEPENPGAEEDPDTKPEDKPSPERTEEDEDKEWQGKLKKGQLIYTDKAKGWAIIGEDLSIPDNPRYEIQEVETGRVVKQSQKDIEEKSFTKLPSAIKHFNSGDAFKLNDKVVSVDYVALGGDKDNPEWSYVINGNPYTHEEISNLINDGKLKHLTDEKPPVTPYDMGSREEFEAAVDEQMDRLSEDPVQLEQVGDDISFNFLGFTFNNLYLADEFKDGELVPLPNENQRIDNGYGLYKINPSVYKYKSQIEEDLCKIRKQLEFGTNQEIVDSIQDILQLPEYKDLTIRWAFISKVDGKYLSGKYSRMQKPEAQLEYMRKDDVDTMRKTLSAIIYDKDGNAILELPIITLQSPHSIFHELQKKGIASDITDKWTFDKKEERQTLDELTAILEVIKAKDPSLKGYKQLGMMINLWLFTSTGVKLLPKDWNLSQESENLGNLYITERTSANYTRHDFHGYWDDIKNLERKDRFISNIYMNKSDEHVLELENRAVSIIPAYTPYVFMSDDPTITSDEAAARQYLKQQSDPTEPKKVIAVIVSPPEVSVSTYIESMHRLTKGQSTNEPYGNVYTSIRIWQAILRDGRSSTIMASLGGKYKNIVNQYIPEITKVEEQNPIQDGETKVAYNKRLAAKLVPILSKRMTIGNSEVSVAEALRKSLVECVYYEQFNPSDDSNTGNMEIMKLIQAVCDGAKITGVLCKPHFTNAEMDLSVGGFAIQVKTDGKYNYPGQGSYRVFGKIDPPTYILNNLFEHIDGWIDDAVVGKDPKTGKPLPANVWKFIHDDADLHYLPKESKKSVNLTPIIERANNFIAKLGILEYNIQTSELQDCNTESEAEQKALELINKKFLENKGVFIIKVNNKYKYGNIIDPRTPEFENYKFDGYTEIGGRYLLRFMDLTTNVMQEIEIELDPTTDTFSIRPNTSKSSAPTLNIKNLKQEIQDKFDNTPILKDNPKWTDLLSKVLQFYNEETNTVDIAAVLNVLDNSGMSRISMIGFRKTIQIDKLIESKQPEEDMCINPIKIRFK